MSSMGDRIAAPANVWTSAFTSAADNTDIGIFNNSPSVVLRVRIGSDATDSDDVATVGYALIQPSERGSFSALDNGDEVYVMPVGDVAGSCTVWE